MTSKTRVLPESRSKLQVERGPICPKKLSIAIASAHIASGRYANDPQVGSASPQDILVAGRQI